MTSFFSILKEGFASLEPPDKQWVSTVYIKGKFASKFSPNSNPSNFSQNKRQTRTGFEFVFRWRRKRV